MIRTIFTGWRVVAIAFILVSAFATISGNQPAAAAGTTISPGELAAACARRGGTFHEIWQDGLLVGYYCVWGNGDHFVECDYAGNCEYIVVPYAAPETAPITTAPADATGSGRYDTEATGTQYGGSAYEYDVAER